MVCDKCGKEVESKNDATVIEAYAFDQPLVMLFNQSRHFLPTEDCEGSPSRAQYIKGQPRDTRGYKYDAGQEKAWRKGYAIVQAQRN